MERLDATVGDGDAHNRESIVRDPDARRRREHLVAEPEHQRPGLAHDQTTAAPSGVNCGEK